MTTPQPNKSFEEFVEKWLSRWSQLAIWKSNLRRQHEELRAALKEAYELGAQETPEFTLEYKNLAVAAARASLLTTLRQEVEGEIRGYRDDLRFVWRWIDRLHGGKPHDKPEENWRSYVEALVCYPNSPHETGDWYEDDSSSPFLSSLLKTPNQEPDKT